MTANVDIVTGFLVAVTILNAPWGVGLHLDPGERLSRLGSRRRRQRPAFALPEGEDRGDATDGTVINHVGFIVQNVQEQVAKWKANGVAVLPGGSSAIRARAAHCSSRTPLS